MLFLLLLGFTVFTVESCTPTLGHVLTVFFSFLFHLKHSFPCFLQIGAHSRFFLHMLNYFGSSLAKYPLGVCTDSNGPHNFFKNGRDSYPPFPPEILNLSWKELLLSRTIKKSPPLRKQQNCACRALPIPSFCNDTLAKVKKKKRLYIKSLW